MVLGRRLEGEARDGVAVNGYTGKAVDEKVRGGMRKAADERGGGGTILEE
jgi:hypothetical protein